MSSKISELQVADDYISLKLSNSYKGDPKRTAKCIKEIFFAHDLEIVQFDSSDKAFNNIRVRYNKIVTKILANKRYLSLIHI